MKATNIIIEIIGILLQSIVIATFFKSIAKKTCNKKILLVVYAIFNTALVLNRIFIENTLISISVVIGMTSILSLFYDIKLTMKVFGVVIINVILGLSETIVGLLLMGFLKITLGALVDNIVYYTVAVLLSMVIAFFIVKVLVYKYKPNELNLSMKTLLLFLFFPVVTFVVGVLLIGSFGNEISNSMGVMGSVSIALLVVANIFIFYLFERYALQLNKKNMINLEFEKLKRDKSYFQELISRQSESSKVMHDLKNQLFAIKTLIKKDVTLAIEQIDNICEVVQSKESIIFTRNQSVDALINTKKQTMDENNITFSCDSFTSGFGDINDIDLCIILGNLLDNSIEACMEISGPRSINVSFRQLGNCISIEVSNTISKTIEIIGDLIPSTKSDKYNHGIGIKSVREIVSRYNGTVDLSSMDKTFNVSIMLIEE